MHPIGDSVNVVCRISGRMPGAELELFFELSWSFVCGTVYSTGVQNKLNDGMVRGPLPPPPPASMMPPGQASGCQAGKGLRSFGRQALVE